MDIFMHAWCCILLNDLLHIKAHPKEKSCP